MQDELDLHGMRARRRARRARRIPAQCRQARLRCVRVIHGKGLGSAGGEPVLKSMVHSWLVQKEEVDRLLRGATADGGIRRPDRAAEGGPASLGMALHLLDHGALRRHTVQRDRRPCTWRSGARLACGNECIALCQKHRITTAAAHALIKIIEILAILVGAFSGFIEARRKRMDVVGVFTVAFITAFGGGTLRDILLDKRPLFWVTHQEYAILIFVLALVARPLIRTLRQIVSERLIVIADAFGLGLFSVAGVPTALDAAHAAVHRLDDGRDHRDFRRRAARYRLQRGADGVPGRQALRDLRLPRKLDVPADADEPACRTISPCGRARCSSPCCAC